MLNEAQRWHAILPIWFGRANQRVDMVIVTIRPSWHTAVTAARPVEKLGRVVDLTRDICVRPGQRARKGEWHEPRRHWAPPQSLGRLAYCASNVHARTRSYPLGRLSQEFVTGATIRQTYDVSASTLRGWADQGKVEAIRTQGGSGKRRYRLSDVARALGDDETKKANARRRICYARVSSAHQHADLERQCANLQRERPEHEIIQDTGSGINWKRAGLLTLLDAVCEGVVAEVVVTHRDRLARIGVELLEWLFRRYDTRFVVLSPTEDEHDTDSSELRDDLLAVVTFFVARNNGRRAAANRKRRRAAAALEEGEDREKEGRETKRRKSTADSRVSQRETTTTPGAVVRDSETRLQLVSRSHQSGSLESFEEGSSRDDC
jgi:predicted site-specific integrase-resolvase